jgi:hypothetical protein
MAKAFLPLLFVLLYSPIALSGESAVLAVPELVFLEIDADSHTKLAADPTSFRESLPTVLATLRSDGVRAVFIDYGFPVNEYPQGASSSQIARFKAATQKLRSEAQAYRQSTQAKLFICSSAVSDEGEPAEVEDFVSWSGQGSCSLTYPHGIFEEVTTDGETNPYVVQRQGSADGVITQYCMKDSMGSVSPHLGDASFAQNAQCPEKYKNIVVNILGYLGLTVTPQDFDQTKFVTTYADGEIKTEYGLPAAAPQLFASDVRTYSYFDAFAGRLSKDELEGRVVFLGPAFGKGDMHPFQGKFGYGIYDHLFNYLDLSADTYKALLPKEVSIKTDAPPFVKFQ